MGIRKERERGRLSARPQEAAVAGAPRGLRPLELTRDRDALVYVPAGYRPDRWAPLVVALHGANGNARGAIRSLQSHADDSGFILVAPSSRGRTWDVLVHEFGPDVDILDRALQKTFARYKVDPNRLAISGFSDGASYALSLGLTNGDFFTHVIAFSPGFAAPDRRRGSPRLFISHGRRDSVLPIDRTSREVVPVVRRWGYDVTYREFDGGHLAPEPIIDEAVTWFLGRGRTPT